MENAIRPFVIGRKNYLFCDTPKGATSSAVVYSLVETAKANGIDPYRYPLFPLSELPASYGILSREQIERFLPWNESAKHACARLEIQK